MSQFLRILDKYLLKELTLSFFAVLIVLLLITFGGEATKLLAQAMQGKVPSSIVFELLFLKIPPALEIILPLVALLAVILAVGRLYQDQEMVVLQSCGLSPFYFKKVVFWFLVPVAMLMAFVSLYVSPWSYQQERLLIDQAQTVSPIVGLEAGKFNLLPKGQGVLYAKEINKNGELDNVWLKFSNQGKDVVLVAPKGRFEWIEKRVVLVLEKGYNYQGLGQNQSVTIQSFERFEGYLPELTPIQSLAEKAEKSTSALWGSADLEEQALLQWRLVAPLGVIILGLIGLKMSRTGPRQGRFAKIFLAMVIYIIFNQLLIVGRDAMANGTLSPIIGLWPLIILFAWFALFDFKLTLKPKKTHIKNLTEAQS